MPQALTCPSCGAGLGPADVQCRSCGSRLATVGCPACFAVVSEGARHCPQCGQALEVRAMSPSDRVCPGCRKALERQVLGGVRLDPCPHCGGAWLERASFEALARDQELRASLLGDLPAPERVPHASLEVHYRSCPDCGRMMNRINYARISGVVLDVCKDDGVWFDPDELRRVVAFIQAGGLERSRDRRIQELHEAERQERNAAPAVGGAPFGPSFSGSTGSIDAPWIAASLVGDLLQLFLE